MECVVIASWSCVLIKCYREVGLEGASIYGVHVVRRALVHARIHLSRWVNFNLRFDAIVPDRPFVDL